MAQWIKPAFDSGGASYVNATERVRFAIDLASL